MGNSREMLASHEASELDAGDPVELAEQHAPVERPGDPATLIRLVSHNYSMVDFSHWDDPGGALEPWLYVWPGDGTAGDRCDVADGFAHPQFGNGPPETIAPSGLPKNPYSLASPSGHGCQQTTGT